VATSIARFSEHGHFLQQTPKFTLDLLKNTKTGTRSRYYLNFNALYLDGIHPGEIISKLWFLKMKKLALDRHE